MAPFILKFKGNKSFSPFSNLSDEEGLKRTWKVCTKVAAHLEQGQRLENLSWRLWFLHGVLTQTGERGSKKAFKLDKDRHKPLDELTAPSLKSKVHHPNQLFLLQKQKRGGNQDHQTSNSSYSRSTYQTNSNRPHPQQQIAHQYPSSIPQHQDSQHQHQQTNSTSFYNNYVNQNSNSNLNPDARSQQVQDFLQQQHGFQSQLTQPIGPSNRNFVAEHSSFDINNLHPPILPPSHPQHHQSSFQQTQPQPQPQLSSSEIERFEQLRILERQRSVEREKQAEFIRRFREQKRVQQLQQQQQEGSRPHFDQHQSQLQNPNSHNMEVDLRNLNSSRRGADIKEEAKDEFEYFIGNANGYGYGGNDDEGLGIGSWGDASLGFDSNTFPFLSDPDRMRSSSPSSLSSKSNPSNPSDPAEVLDPSFDPSLYSTSFDHHHFDHQSQQQDQQQQQESQDPRIPQSLNPSVSSNTTIYFDSIFSDFQPSALLGATNPWDEWGLDRPTFEIPLDNLLGDEADNAGAANSGEQQQQQGSWDAGIVSLEELEAQFPGLMRGELQHHHGEEDNDHQQQQQRRDHQQYQQRNNADTNNNELSKTSSSSSSSNEFDHSTSHNSINQINTNTNFFSALNTDFNLPPQFIGWHPPLQLPVLFDSSSSANTNQPTGSIPSWPSYNLQVPHRSVSSSTSTNPNHFSGSSGSIHPQLTQATPELHSIDLPSLVLGSNSSGNRSGSSSPVGTGGSSLRNFYGSSSRDRDRDAKKHKNPMATQAPTFMAGSGTGGRDRKDKDEDGRPKCSNCGAFQTPLWRRGLNEELLCNACGLYLKLHKVNRPKLFTGHKHHHHTHHHTKTGTSRKNSISTSNTGNSTNADGSHAHGHNHGGHGHGREKSNHPAECFNCSATQTPMWRKIEDKLLCNACALYQKLHNSPRPAGAPGERRKRTKHIKHKSDANISENPSSSASSSSATPTATATKTTTHRRRSEADATKNWKSEGDTTKDWSVLGLGLGLGGVGGLEDSEKLGEASGSASGLHLIDL